MWIVNLCLFSILGDFISMQPYTQNMVLFGIYSKYNRFSWMNLKILTYKHSLYTVNSCLYKHTLRGGSPWASYFAKISHTRSQLHKSCIHMRVDSQSNLKCMLHMFVHCTHSNLLWEHFMFRKCKSPFN